MQLGRMTSGVPKQALEPIAGVVQKGGPQGITASVWQETGGRLLGYVSGIRVRARGGGNEWLGCD